MRCSSLTAPTAELQESALNQPQKNHRASHFAYIHVYFFFLRIKTMSNLESSSRVCWVLLCSAGRNWDHGRGQRNWSTTDCQRRCDSIGTGLAKNNASLRGAEIHTCTLTHEMSRDYRDEQRLLLLRGDA